MADETITLEEAQAFLAEFGITGGFAKAKEILKGYKGDIERLKPTAREAEDLKVKLAEYQKKEKDAADADLTASQKLQGQLDQVQKEHTSTLAQVEKLTRDGMLKDAMFEALDKKTYAPLRKKLYQAAALTQEWKSPEELKTVFENVDKEFDETAKATKLPMTPAPGDGPRGNQLPDGDGEKGLVKGLFSKKSVK